MRFSAISIFFRSKAKNAVRGWQNAGFPSTIAGWLTPMISLDRAFASRLTNEEAKECCVDDEHLVRETQNAERRSEPRQSQRRVVEEQTIDALAIAQPPEHDAPDRVRDAYHRDQEGCIRLGDTHLKKIIIEF